MEYTDYSVEDFIRDEYFQKWIMNPDTITLDFWQNWIDGHPEKKEVVQCATDLIRLICDGNTFRQGSFDTDALWWEILKKRKAIKIAIPKSEFRSKKYKAKHSQQILKKNQNDSGSNKNNFPQISGSQKN